MKELQNKYNELETQRCNLIGTKDNVQAEMDKMLKKANAADEILTAQYWELAAVNSTIGEQIREIYKKQRILENAMIVLEGGELE